MFILRYFIHIIHHTDQIRSNPGNTASFSIRSLCLFNSGI